MLDLTIGAPATGPSTAPIEPVNTWSDDSGVIFARAYDNQQQRWIDWVGLGQFVFSAESPLVTLHPARDVDHTFAADVFRRLVQPIVLQAQGYEVLHASAVAGPDGALVFCGVSGSGKSTLAWGVATRDDFEQVADDAVVLDGFDAAADGPLVVPMPHRPRLRAPSQAVFPSAAAHMRHTTTARSRHPHLRAVIILKQDVTTAADPIVQRVPEREAFAALVTHAYCFDDRDREGTRRMAEHYLALAASVPVISVVYRPDFARFPQLVDAILDSVPRLSPRLS